MSLSGMWKSNDNQFKMSPQDYEIGNQLCEAHSRGELVEGKDIFNFQNFNFKILKMSIFWILITALASVSGNLEIEQLGDIFVKEVTPYKNNIGAWAVNLISDKPMLQADYLNCDVCPIALRFMRTLVDLGGSDEEITSAVAKVCELFFLPDADGVCKPTIKGYVETLSYMMKNSKITNDDFCGTINENCGVVNATFTSWETAISGEKPVPVDRPSLPVKKEFKK